jgi:hypothetical protein
VQWRREGEPFPHLVVDEVVAPDVYAGLEFPDDLVHEGAWGLTATDDGYRVALERGWDAIVGQLRSEPFVMRVIEAFADDLAAAGCLVDAERAHVVEFDESRNEKEQRVLHTDGDPNALFTRVDFQSKGAGGYRDFVHLDWDRRVVGGILFFSGSDDEGLVGGELALYRDRGLQNDRWCHDPELAAAYAPAHNTGVLFLNENRAFHGPRRIERLAGRRRWLYFAISSFVDVWPHRERAIG